VFYKKANLIVQYQHVLIRTYTALYGLYGLIRPVRSMCTRL